MFLRVRTWRLVAGLPAILALSTLVLAQGGFPEADALFKNLDVDKDGKLTLGEATGNQRGIMQDVFKMAGKQNSESVSREEFQKVYDTRKAQNQGGAPKGQRPTPGGPGQNRPMPPQGEASGSPPGGGGGPGVALSKADLRRILEQFDQLDTNQDGSLNAEELLAAARPAESRRPGFGTPASTPTENRSGNGRPGFPPAGGSPTENKSGNSKSGTSPRRTGSTSSTSRSSREGGSAASLAGTWKGWVVDGRGENPNAGHMQIELTIEGTRMTAREVGSNRAGADGLGSGTFTITGNGKSGNLDANGTGGREQGKNYLGIFEVDGDTLRWCVGNTGRPRPNDFATGRQNYLMVLKRQ